MLSVIEKKDSLRKGILQKRLKLPFEEIFKLSSIIQKKFLGIRELKKAKQLALYASFKNEVLTETILEYAVTKRKEVFFPRIVRESRGLMFLKVRGKEDLASGSYDIKEPVHDHRGMHKPEISVPLSLDLIVVPGIAFDIKGNRLGYGKGYYDKVLDSMKGKCLIAALAFDFQILNTIPAEAHDIKMDKIITESRVITIERGD